MTSQNRNLLINLIIYDVKGRYFGSFVGIFGSVIIPLILLSIYTFVFSGILKVKFGNATGVGNFAIYLFCGLLPWMAFSEALQRSSTVILDHRPIFKRAPLNKKILPLYVTLSCFLNQIIATIPFIGFLLRKYTELL